MEHQKKPWSELTEAERNEIRKSWKHTLPEEFDVYHIGNLNLSDDTVDFPGTLYVSGSLDVVNLNVRDGLIVDGDIDADTVVVHGSCLIGGNIVASGDVVVYGRCIVNRDVDVFDLTVHNDFISDGDIDICNLNVYNGDCLVLHNIESYGTISIDGILNCYDVESNGNEIHAAGYVCRYYEEEV